jgi:hypothetical protein
MDQAAKTLVDAQPIDEEPEITVTPAVEPAPKPPAGSTRRWTAVLLVLLAAAVASTAVYFLLPLLS